MSNKINLEEINDEATLRNILDQVDVENADYRKAIRTRIQTIRAAEKAKREERLNRLTNTREDMLRQRQKECDELKQRTLSMYEHMAKSAPAGGDKTMDISIYKNTPESSIVTGSGKKDLVEEAIRQRQRDADEKKKKILDSFNPSINPDASRIGYK